MQLLIDFYTGRALTGSQRAMKEKAIKYRKLGHQVTVQNMRSREYGHSITLSRVYFRRIRKATDQG